MTEIDKQSVFKIIMQKLIIAVFNLKFVRLTYSSHEPSDLDYAAV